MARANPDTRAKREGSAAAGFSLLEVMIALGILTISVVAMTAGTISATRVASDSRGKTLAAFLAEQQMEAFRAMAADAVTDLITEPGYPNDPANPIDAVPGAESAGTFNRRWIIEPDTPATGAIRITVEVDYLDSAGKTRTLRLQSIKADT